MKRATFWALVATALLTTACALPQRKQRPDSETMRRARASIIADLERRNLDGLLDC